MKLFPENSENISPEVVKQYLTILKNRASAWVFVKSPDACKSDVQTALRVEVARTHSLERVRRGVLNLLMARLAEFERKDLEDRVMVVLNQKLGE